MSEQGLIEASPCKLRNGNWGCRTAEPVKVGDTVRIVTRAHKQWRAEITQIVWTDDQTCICATDSENSRKASGSTAPSEGHSAPKKSSRKASTPSRAANESGAAPSPTENIPTDELDAMADAAAAAARDGEHDELMNVVAEFERDECK